MRSTRFYVLSCLAGLLGGYAAWLAVFFGLFAWWLPEDLAAGVSFLGGMVFGAIGTLVAMVVLDR